MKKCIAIIIGMIMLCTTSVFAEPLDNPTTIRDDEFAKMIIEANKGLHSAYNYEEMSVGQSVIGLTGGSFQTGPDRIEEKIPVYILNVKKEGFISIDASATNLAYGTEPIVSVDYIAVAEKLVKGNGISFRRQMKQWFNVAYTTYTRRENGIYSFYAFPGTYYVTVKGSNYKTYEKKGVDSQYLDFKMTAFYNNVLKADQFVAQKKTAVIFSLLNKDDLGVEPAKAIEGTVTFRGETKAIESTMRHDSLNDWDYYVNTVRFDDVPTDITFDVSVNAIGYAAYKQPFMRQTTDLTPNALYQSNPVYYTELYIEPELVIE